MENEYTPISCSFHDELLSLATRKTQCSIRYRDVDDRELTVTDIIVDVYTKKKEEFLTLNNGSAMRLDQLVNAGGTSMKQEN